MFAINEEAYTFISGVSNDFEEYIEYYIKKSNDKFLEKLKEKLVKEEFSMRQINQILSIIKILLNEYYFDKIEMIKNYKLNALEETSELAEYLPKTILWDLSDYLIKLTALKQKFSFENETVSSETEIVFISKTNNFEWIKKQNEKFKYKVKT